jgi:hypothetical protein
MRYFIQFLLLLALINPIYAESIESPSLDAMARGNLPLCVCLLVQLSQMMVK